MRELFLCFVSAALLQAAVGCGGSVDARSSPDAAKVTEPAPDAGQAATGGWSTDNPTCRNDTPLPPPVNAKPEEGGSRCTLPDGGRGVGEGAYGCVDPTVCLPSLIPGGGPWQCRIIDGVGEVVYQSCNSANAGQMCAEHGGGTGTCCAGSCQAISLATDTANCGGCGVVCPQGASHSCASGYCENITSCPAGTGMVSDNAGDYQGCAPTSCTGQPDGAACVFMAGAAGGFGRGGACCGAKCVDITADDANCGGCGVTCCAGHKCIPGAPTSGALEHLPGLATCM